MNLPDASVMNVSPLLPGADLEAGPASSLCQNAPSVKSLLQPLSNPSSLSKHSYYVRISLALAEDHRVRYAYAYAYTLISL